MILVGRYTSPFVRRVGFSLSYLGFKFERKPINTWSNIEELREYNPVGRIPALVIDTGEVLFDSHAILDYIDFKVGPDRALIPLHEPDRHNVMRTTFCALGALEKIVHCVYEVAMRPKKNVSDLWLEHNLKQATLGLTWLDQIKQTPWLSGVRLTQADITTAVLSQFAFARFPDRFPRGIFPNLDSLDARIMSLPAWEETSIPADEARGGPSLPARG